MLCHSPAQEMLTSLLNSPTQASHVIFPRLCSQGCSHTCRSRRFLFVPKRTKDNNPLNPHTSNPEYLPLEIYSTPHHLSFFPGTVTPPQNCLILMRWIKVKHKGRRGELKPKVSSINMHRLALREVAEGTES